MKTDILTLRSSIKEELVTQALKKGSIIAIIGLAPMIYTALFWSVSELSRWGLIIFFAGMGAVAYGLIPYRRLVQLQNFPNKLIVTEDDTLEYVIQEKRVITIPLSTIESVNFFEKNQIYGIAINLKQKPKEKVIVYKRNFDLVKFQKESIESSESDLFFPYFTRRSFNQLPL